MPTRTRIEWTEVTWNPVTGCDMTSAGCRNCYAKRFAARLKAMGQPRYQRDGKAGSSGLGFGITMHWDLVHQPERWRNPRLVFVNSMGDLFHPDVSERFILAVFDTMQRCEWHTFQVLTKRSKRLAGLAHKLPWPPNIWIGASVENTRYRSRINDLRQVPASVRFLSLEPLIGPIEEIDLSGIHWVIVGGESGPGARVLEPEWVLSIRDQCNQASVPFFFKQWGGRTPKARGRELEGRNWDEKPCQENRNHSMRTSFVKHR
jgi:protein gp37